MQQTLNSYASGRTRFIATLSASLFHILPNDLTTEQIYDQKFYIHSICNGFVTFAAFYPHSCRIFFLCLTECDLSLSLSLSLTIHVTVARNVMNLMKRIACCLCVCIFFKVKEKQPVGWQTIRLNELCASVG